MEDNTDEDDSSDDDSNELPFLARESVALPRPSHDQKGARDAENAAGRHSKEVMEIPEAVEAVTGVNASYLSVRSVADTKTCSSLVLCFMYIGTYRGIKVLYLPWMLLIVPSRPSIVCIVLLLSDTKLEAAVLQPYAAQC